MSGWLFKAAQSNSDSISDAAAGDAVFVTNDASTRFLFGCGTDSVASLSIDAFGAHVTSLSCVGTALTTPSGRLDAGALEGHVPESSIAPASVAADRIKDHLPVTAGGTGLPSIPDGLLLVGSGTGPVATDPRLSWDAASGTLGASNVAVAGSLMLAGRGDLDAALTGIQESVDAVASGASLANGGVTPAKLAGPVPVEKGGTGQSNLAAGALLLGDGTGPVATDPRLYWDAASGTLGASNVAVAGSLTLADHGDLDVALTGIQESVDAVASGASLVDGGVTPAKLAGPVPVDKGGTGLDQPPPPGLIMYGPDVPFDYDYSLGPPPLEFSHSFKYEAAEAKLSVGKAAAAEEVSVGAWTFSLSNDDLVIGSPGGSNLSMTKVMRFFSSVDVYSPP